MVEQHIGRTGVVPETVGADDSYAGAKGKRDDERMGVGNVSIGGAKGQRMTPVEDWESEISRKARERNEDLTD